MKNIAVKVIVIFMLLILPLNVLVVFQANAMIASTVEQVRMSEQSMMDVYGETLANRMDNAVSLLYYFETKNTECLSMTQQTEKNYTYQKGRQQLYYSFRTMADMIDGAEGYFFFFPKVSDMIMLSGSSVDEEQEKNLQEQMLADQARETRGWYIQEAGDNTYAVLYIELKNVSYGAWIDLSDIADNIRKSLDYESLDVVIGEGELPENELFASFRMDNIYIGISLEQDEIIRVHALYQRIQFVMALCCLGLIPVLFLFIRKIFIAPLKKINDAHVQFQKGNMDYRLPEKAGSREFEMAYRSFNKMADHIKDLRIREYESKIEKQKMELRNLQLQIRPHFLQNTFNLIYSLAQARDTESIQNTMLYLSSYFRFIFRSDKELELFAKELNLIEGYIDMASLRYDNGIEFSCDIDPEVEMVRMPPLLIHNFVENAVKYGVCQDRILHIDLQARYDDKRVTFTIMDDGNGMSAEILERNQKMFRGEYVPEDKNAHLGLYNSLKRLKYFYGDTAYIEVISEPGESTCFTISFPYNMEFSDDPGDI